MNFKNKKSLGQNFLIDRKILEQIVNTVEIKDKEKFLEELKKLSSENDFYMHSDDDGEIAINTSLIQAIEFSDDSEGKSSAGLVPNG